MDDVLQEANGGPVKAAAEVAGCIGEVELEQVQAAVEGVDETHPARQGVDHTDTAAGDAAGAVGDVIVEVPGGKHGSLASGAVGLVGAALAAALAAGQLLTYLGFHWKASRATRGSGRR